MITVHSTRPSSREPLHAETTPSVGVLDGAPASNPFFTVVNNEIRRAARHDRPFTILAVRGRSGARRMSILSRRPSVDMDMLRDRLRPYDVLSAPTSGVTYVVCPAVEGEAASKLVERLTRDLNVGVGAAKFPEDGSRPEDLLAVARARAV